MFHGAIDVPSEELNDPTVQTLTHSPITVNVVQTEPVPSNEPVCTLPDPEATAFAWLARRMSGNALSVWPMWLEFEGFVCF